MAAKKIKGHLHTYKKKKYGANKRLILMCTSPGCTHFLPDLSLAEGRLCECYICHSPMIIDKKALLNVNIHCPNCTKPSKKQKPIVDLANILDV